MKEYRFKWHIFLNYSFVILFEGLLIFTAFQMNQFKGLLIGISIFVLVLSLYYFVRQMTFRFSISEELIEVKSYGKVIYQVKFEEIRGLIEKKRSLEIQYKLGSKMRVLHINWFLQNYREFVNELKQALRDKNIINDINYIV